MNYMKGYNDRIERRRSSYRRSRFDRRRRGRNPVPGILKVAVPILACAIAVVAGIWFFDPFGYGEPGKLAVSGVSIEANADAHAATSDAAAKASDGTASEETAAPTAEGAGGAASGGVVDAVAAVGTLSPDAIATPAPTQRPKAVALTFDDGPSTVNTPKILKVLEKHNAHATFFVLGQRSKAGTDILKKELEIGCEIANHTWDHKSLADMAMSSVNKEYDRTASLVRQLTGYKVTMLRPPYGAISNVMRQKLKHPMIYWSIDTLDWKSKNAKKVFREIKKNVSDGDIILMHDIHPTTAEAVEKIVPWLLDQGYDLLTVSELMERKGIKLKNGIVYASAK